MKRRKGYAMEKTLTLPRRSKRLKSVIGISEVVASSLKTRNKTSDKLCKWDV